MRRFSAGLQIAARGQSVAAAEHPREGEDIRVSGLTGGLGWPLALTALARLPGPVLSLRVVSTNERALALYRRIGFGGAREVSRVWRL